MDPRQGPHGGDSEETDPSRKTLPGEGRDGVDILRSPGPALRRADEGFEG